MTTTHDDTEELRGVHRRIRNMLDSFPASTWNLAESKAVEVAVARIVRRRPQRERLPSSPRHVSLVPPLIETD